MSPAKDLQSVTPDGESVAPRIHGVAFLPAVTHVDERGSVCEIVSPSRMILPDPITYVYQVSIRPGMVKGWHVHYLHDDRIFLSQGDVKMVLYDSRRDSPTFGMINEVHRSDLGRGVTVIPAHVYHALQNVGPRDVLLFSMPTAPYDHANPDVYRLPLDTDQIPYRFEKRLGW